MMFNSTEVVTNFVFLQYSGHQPWYVLLHTFNNFENKFETFKASFSSPVGKKSYITVDVYDKRWVQNIESKFMHLVTINRYGL